MHGLPFRCFNSATGVVTDAVVNVQYGYAYCEVVGDSYPWHMPDVVIPDGTTFKDPLDDKKYTVRTTEAIETLERLDNSECRALDLTEVSLDYPTQFGLRRVHHADETVDEHADGRVGKALTITSR